VIPNSYMFLLVSFDAGSDIPDDQDPSCHPLPGADPGFLLEEGAPLRNDVTIQDFS